MRIDLLVIKKNKNIQIANELGAVFRGYNIMEYKSEDDSLSIDTVLIREEEPDMGNYFKELFKDDLSKAKIEGKTEVVIGMVKEGLGLVPYFSCY